MPKEFQFLNGTIFKKLSVLELKLKLVYMNIQKCLNRLKRLKYYKIINIKIFSNYVGKNL